MGKIWLCLGMIWLMSNPTMSSSSSSSGGIPICWQKMFSCINSKMDNSTLQSDPSNLDEMLCCSLVQQEADLDKKCFCSIKYVADSKMFSYLIWLFSQCNLSQYSPFSSYCPTPENPKTGMIVSVVAPIGVVLLLIFALCLFFRFRKSKKKSDPTISDHHHGLSQGVQPSEPMVQDPPPSALPVQVSGNNFMTPESLQYEVEVLRVATNNFSNDNKIGQGGFGPVYKGILPNGQEIAVKRLSMSSSQGDKEFKNEVVLLAKLQHRNLVKLLGFCLTGDEQLLVYEFVPNKSLDYFLFDSLKKEQLNWLMRYNIIRGVARGMLYFHEDSPIRIIHRDLKAGNILLDTKMNPKISDFGLARISRFEQTHVSTIQVVGTYGYMAPEYLIHGQFSAKSDVYSFGVLILEIVSGRRINAYIHQSGEVGEGLLSYAWKCWGLGRPLELMDETLRSHDSYSQDQAIRCIQLGLLCVQEDINKRPTMDSIVLALNSNSRASELAMPQPPVFLYAARDSDQSTTATRSSNNSMPWSQNEGFIGRPSLR